MEKENKEEKPYSSIPETQEHVLNVKKMIENIRLELWRRGEVHDQSKMENPELEGFDKYTPLLKGLVYGSDEYKASLEAMKPFLKHHYENNRHHPEHFDNGVDGMSLVDIIEMFCDWYAASKRTKNGSMQNSIDFSCQRFKIVQQLQQIFLNTMRDLKLD